MENESEEKEIEIGSLSPEELAQRRRINAACELLLQILADLGEPAELLEEPEGRAPTMRYGRNTFDIGQEAVNTMGSCDFLFKDERRVFPFSARALQGDLVRARTEKYFEHCVADVLARIHSARIRDERQIAIKADLVEEKTRLALQLRWRPEIREVIERACQALLDRVEQRKAQINGRRRVTRDLKRGHDETLQDANLSLAEAERKHARLKVENIYLSGQPLRPSDLVNAGGAADQGGGAERTGGQKGTARRRSPRTRRPVLPPRR